MSDKRVYKRAVVAAVAATAVLTSSTGHAWAAPSQPGTVKVEAAAAQPGTEKK